MTSTRCSVASGIVFGKELPMSTTTTLTLRMPEDMREQLDRLAAATARSRSRLAIEAIYSYLALQEWQIGEIQKGLEEAEAGEFASEEEVLRVFGKWRDDG
jgi:RHH-type rel operon transcriptional repressor/antitoxin RelB